MGDRWGEQCRGTDEEMELEERWRCGMEVIIRRMAAFFFRPITCMQLLHHHQGHPPKQLWLILLKPAYTSWNNTHKTLTRGSNKLKIDSHFCTRNSKTYMNSQRAAIRYVRSVSYIATSAYAR